ncbi:hypothetical protein L6R29_23205 [Myxococcota bacterium]|nr:hypothetical protein [Myxococcota bacterium]
MPQQKQARKGGSCEMDIQVVHDRDVDAIRCNCPVFGQPQGAAPPFCDYMMGGFRISPL